MCTGKGLDELYKKCNLYVNFVDQPYWKEEERTKNNKSHHINWDIIEKETKILEDMIDNYLNPTRRINLSFEELVLQEVNIHKINLNKKIEKDFYISACKHINNLYPYMKITSQKVQQIIYKERKKLGIKIYNNQNSKNIEEKY
jgi:hypothetical protein